jgi:allophanate hydrolase
VPTTAGCPAFAYEPAASAEAVRRLIAAGAIPVGKTNLDQFATGLVGLRSPYPIPRNAFDPAIVPGGSSSGSAVAVARGFVSFALGTDTAGSGRVPAGLNNIVGLKPSLGAVSVRGVVPACRTLDCVSVFGLTVPDAWTVVQAMAGFDPADPWSRRVSLGTPAPVPPATRIGVPDAASRNFLGDRLAEAAFDTALTLLRALGHRLVELDFTPFFETARLLYEGAWVAERYEAIREVVTHRPEIMHPVTLQITRGAERLSAADAFAGMYRLAGLRRTTEPVWDDIEMLAVPTFPRPVTCAEVAADPIGPNAGLGTYTNFVNLLDLCALAVPGPFRSDKFPAGITLIAPSGRDSTLAALATAFHSRAGLTLGATGVAQPVASLPLAAPDGDEVEIVVVGAHLTGLPLNSQLVALGGQFRRAVATTADYALYALPDTQPPKPGLQRVARGEGREIETEVWALPPAGFGRFVAAIPSPLSIGTIRLKDGTSPKGFLCETAGLAGALDVSAHGGWRRYLATMEPAPSR